MRVPLTERMEAAAMRGEASVAKVRVPGIDEFLSACENR
jgi:hypothetical protein